MFVLDLDVKDNLNNSKIVNVSKENKNKDIFNNNINQSAKFLKIALESKNKKNLIKKLNNLLEGEFSFFESKYTNYVFINFYNNWEKYITNNLKKIFENNKDFYNFKIISKNDNSKKEEILANENDTDRYEYTYIGRERKKNFNHIGLTDKKIDYLSSGNQRIKLGILDNGKISLNSNLFNTNLITNKSRFLAANDVFGEHATDVASIAGGYNGVNKNINLYGIKIFLWNGIEQEIEWLISNGVKVINISYGFGINNNYNGYADYFDKLSNNFENEVTFVTSAGNNGDKNDRSLSMLQQHKLSYNSVVVGASDAINYFEKADYSSYGSLNNTKEVTLIAPPGIFDKYDVYDKKEKKYSGIHYNGGTSYSSPVVASVLASYMNKKSYIYDKGLDSIISLSALSSSATHNDTINSKIGAGLLNVDNFERALESLNYIKLKGDSYVAENQEDITTHKVYLKKGQKLKAALAWNFKNEFDKEWPWYMFGASRDIIEKPIVHDFDLYIYNKNDKTDYSSSTSSKRNIEVASLRAKSDGWYEIKIKQYKKLNKDQSFDLAVTYSVQ